MQLVTSLSTTLDDVICYLKGLPPPLVSLGSPSTLGLSVHHLGEGLLAEDTAVGGDTKAANLLPRATKPEVKTAEP